MIVTTDDIITALEQLTLMGRSEQVVIGPSEVGIDCERCLARKMSEMQKDKVISSWRTTIGRAVHELAERDVPPQFPDGAVIAEGRLFIHQYKNFTLAGNSDVFLPNDGDGCVLDYKIVGDDTLERMRRVVDEGKGEAEQKYIIQGHLYGLGWLRKGYPVKKVAIMFLPANKGDLRRYHVVYQYDFDVAVAAAALAKIELLIDEAEADGWERVIRRRDPKRGCLSCSSYVTADNPQRDFLAGFGK